MARLDGVDAASGTHDLGDELGHTLGIYSAYDQPLAFVVELSEAQKGRLCCAIEPAGAPGMPPRTTPPKIGSFASFQHPAIRATNTNGMDQMARLVTPSNLFILLPFFV